MLSKSQHGEEIRRAFLAGGSSQTPYYSNTATHHQSSDVYAYGSPQTWQPPQTYHQASGRRTAWAAGIRQWEEEWAKAPSGVDYRQHYSGLDKKHSLFYRRVENKALSSILIQLRTGKVGFSHYHYLHKICNDAGEHQPPSQRRMGARMGELWYSAL